MQIGGAQQTVHTDLSALFVYIAAQLAVIVDMGKPQGMGHGRDGFIVHNKFLRFHDTSSTTGWDGNCQRYNRLATSGG